MRIKIISGDVSVVAELRNTPTAKEVVEIGDMAYWPEGSCFCIFWGRTPASKGNEIRAASEVNVFGRIKNAKVFSKVKNTDLIVLEKA